MSDSETLSPEEIDRRLNRLNTILGSLDDPTLKRNLVLMDYVELINFPTDSEGWATLKAECNIKTTAKFNSVKNLITPLQHQQTQHQGTQAQ